MMNVAQAKAVVEKPIETFTESEIHGLIDKCAEVNEAVKPLTLIKKNISIKVKEYMVRTECLKIVTDAGSTATLTSDHDRLSAIDVEAAQELVAEGRLSQEAFNLVFRDKRIACSLKIA